MAIFGLNRVELISECKVILVALLDLEDLCFQLRNEQVFLVTCEMDTVVILKKVTETFRRTEIFVKF